jgi:hypothetical protein
MPNKFISNFLCRAKFGFLNPSGAAFLYAIFEEIVGKPSETTEVFFSEIIDQSLVWNNRFINRRWQQKKVKRIDAELFFSHPSVLARPSRDRSPLSRLHFI